MRNEATILPIDLAERIAADAVPFFGLPEAPRIATIEARAHPYSRVLRLALAGPTGRQHLYVKLPVRTPGRDEIVAARLEAEFRILNALGDGFARRPRLGVVRAFAFYPEHLAIVTVEAPGATLRHVLGRAARWLRVPGQRRALLEQARLCGAWLRTFQALTDQRGTSFDRQEMVEYCATRTTRLAQLSRAWSEGGLSTKLLARLDEVITAVPTEENRSSGRHNDFAMHNIIAGANGITVLDFGMFDHGSAAFDPCNFWLSLEVLKSDPTYSHAFLADLQHAFLDAYGGIDPAHPLFAAVRCRYSLNRLLTVLDDAAPRPLGWFGHRMADACQSWLHNFAESGVASSGHGN